MFYMVIGNHHQYVKFSARRISSTLGCCVCYDSKRDSRSEGMISKDTDIKDETDTGNDDIGNQHSDLLRESEHIVKAYHGADSPK